MTAADETSLDPDIEADLYVRYADELTRFLVGVLGDRQLAADVVQSTFVKLVRQGHTTRQSTRKAWLFRVAYCEAMAVRRRQSTGDKVVRRLAWLRVDSAAAADEPLVRTETVRRVRAAIESLTPKQKQIVKMRIYEEKTFAVIAQELDIPLGTALGRMHGAMGNLRQALTDDEQTTRRDDA